MRIVVLAMAVGLVAANANAQDKPSTARQIQTQGGRWQIINPTPELARHIMLLDTITGESWVMCRGPNNEAGWCRMIRFTGPSGGTIDPGEK